MCEDFHANMCKDNWKVKGYSGIKVTKEDCVPLTLRSGSECMHLMGSNYNQ